MKVEKRYRDRQVNKTIKKTKFIFKLMSCHQAVGLYRCVGVSLFQY